MCLSSVQHRNKELKLRCFPRSANFISDLRAESYTAQNTRGAPGGGTGSDGEKALCGGRRRAASTRVLVGRRGKGPAGCMGAAPPPPDGAEQLPRGRCDPGQGCPHSAHTHIPQLFQLLPAAEPRPGSPCAPSRISFVGVEDELSLSAASM